MSRFPTALFLIYIEEIVQSAYNQVDIQVARKTLRSLFSFIAVLFI